MIVCPSCQFENPSHHRYCQECGELLSQEPMVSVAGVEQKQLDGQKAHHSAATQLMEDSMLMNPSTSFNQGQFEQGFDHDNPSLSNDVLPEMTQLAILRTVPSWMNHQSGSPKYLDQYQRYKILTSFSEPVVSDHSIEVVVVDLKPSAPPYRKGAKKPNTLSKKQTKEVLEEENGSRQSLPEKRVDFTPPHLLCSKEDNELDLGDLPYFLLQDVLPHDGNIDLGVNALTVVPVSPNLDLPLTTSAQDEQSRIGKSHVSQNEQSQIEQVYLALEEQLYPSFPQLLDSWTDDETIIVIENRESLSSLSTVLSQTRVVMPQVLHWLHEMTELWNILGMYRCCCSLLTLDNIRVDEDQILCLKRLHFDEADSEYTLKDLGNVWKRLSEQSSQHWADTILEIFDGLARGVIVDINTLRQHLEIVADQIHQETIPGDEDLSGRATSGPQPLISLDEFAQAVQSETGATEPPLNALYPSEGGSKSPPSILGRTSSSDDPTVVLPMQLHTLSNAGITNIGIQRDHNEDFFAIDTQIQSTDTPDGRVCKAKGLYILCDGMGGHAAGEVASALAGETLQAYFQDHWTDSLPLESVIYDGVVLANQVIYEQNQASESEGSRRMGTTLVMLLVQDTKAAIAHVGDSRIYRFTRRQGLEQLTVDHEVGQREIARGVDPIVAYSRPDAYQLTQALGPRAPDFIRPDIKFFEMHEDSLFILGSDGLTDNDLVETYCEQYIEPLISTNANLDEGAYNLIDLANQVNGHDNITALLVRVKLRPKLSLLGR